MPSSPYPHGLTELSPGAWAWLQPDGSWGLSNAGLITDGEASLLVDTLWDLPRTQAMLTAMAQADPAAKAIGTVINTHANGDHCWGNALVQGADIVASRRSAEEMDELPPKKMATLMKAAKLVTALGPVGRGLGSLCKTLGLQKAAGLVEAAPYVAEVFAPFEFEGNQLVHPTRTFDGELTLKVGDKEVHLLEVGPAHTAGDVLVHVPSDGVLYAGDILFIEGHPILWEGPIENWVSACDRIPG